LHFAILSFDCEAQILAWAVIIRFGHRTEKAPEREKRRTEKIGDRKISDAIFSVPYFSVWLSEWLEL